MQKIAVFIIIMDLLLCLFWMYYYFLLILLFKYFLINKDVFIKILNFIPLNLKDN